MSNDQQASEAPAKSLPVLHHVSEWRSNRLFILVFATLFRWGVIDFATDLLFVLSPFKLKFWMTVLYRRLTGRTDLDRHFRFFCARRLRSKLKWVMESPRSDKYVNELVALLIVADQEKLALKLFPEIDWKRGDTAFFENLGAMTTKLISGYSMELLSQIHTIDWGAVPKRHLPVFTKLVSLMLEHRDFDYEKRTFEGRQIHDPDLFEAPIEEFIGQFFCDRELIDAVYTQLAMPRRDDIIAARSKDGQYWERLPPDHPQRPLLTEINTFYAYRHLLLTTYHSGEGFHVPRVYRALDRTQQRLRRSLPAPSPKLKSFLDRLDIDLPEVRLLSPDWSALIGHNGHLNVHLMMRGMGWWTGKPLMLAYDDRIANKPFLSLFSEICPTLILNGNVDADIWHEVASLTPFIGTSHQAFAFQDGRSMYWNDAGSLALKEWESQRRGFPLRDIYDRRMLVNNRSEEHYQMLRARWGMKVDDWFVCLHVRDGRTRNDTERAGESIRNASLDTYLGAIRHITQLGGWVIRMGGRKAPPMPEMDRVIDYARSDDQIPEMDIHLMRRARMFIGTTSGFAYVASSFGVPTAMVNALSSVGLLWSTDTRFAWKPIRRKDGHMLSLSEMTSDRYRWAYPTHEAMTRAGLVADENSPDEILGTVQEVLEISDPSRTGPPPGVDNSWERHVNVPGFFGGSRPSRYFLEKYAGTLLASD